MTKIIFSFSGTGETHHGEIDKEHSGITGPLQRVKYQDDVIRVYFQGCQHANVGGGSIDPDLSIAAKKIRKAFNLRTKSINLAILEQEFDDAMTLNYGSWGEKEAVPSNEITRIGIEGYSRGGVSTFATAKALDDLQIPIDLIANQPIPGQIFAASLFRNLFKDYHDLTQCKNLASATILLCTYDLKNDMFCRQMVAKFPPSTPTNIWYMPIQGHGHFVLRNIVFLQLKKLLVETGYIEDTEILFGQRSYYRKELIQNEYKNYKEEGVYYTPPEFLEAPFGEAFLLDYFAKGQVSRAPLDLIKKQNQAKEDLKELKIPLKAMSDEQASAIVAVHHLKFAKVKQVELTNLILAENNQKFLTTLNELYELYKYSAKRLAPNDKILKVHFKEFLQKIISHIYDNLLTNKHSANIHKAIDSFKELYKLPDSSDKNKVLNIITKSLEKIYSTENKAKGIEANKPSFSSNFFRSFSTIGASLSDDYRLIKPTTTSTTSVSNHENYSTEPTSKLGSDVTTNESNEVINELDNLSLS